MHFLLIKEGSVTEEEWVFVDGLKRTRTSRVCITCQHFSYATNQHCHTLLTCAFRDGMFRYGEHQTKKCRHWTVRRKVEIG